MSRGRRCLVLLAAASCAAAWRLDAGARIAAAPPRARGGLDPATPTVPSSILDLAAAEEWCTERGVSAKHLQSVYRHIFRRGGELSADALHRDAGLPRATAEELCASFVGATSCVVESVPSAGGRKLVVELASGHRVETVMILHEHRSSGRRRCTVCVSSQIGCGRACTFCATGGMGAVADLRSHEILEQVWHARDALSDGAYQLRNVVFMGMGEPCDNLPAVLGALRGLTHQSLFDLAAPHVTVSTVGAEPGGIRTLADLAPRVRLALSLHGPTQALRQAIMPSARAVPLEELTAALDYHAASTRSGLMVEYLLIAGLNDQPEHAAALADFCIARAAGSASPSSAYCNLIPYNPTSVGERRGYKTPTDEQVAAFHTALRRRGVNALVRWTSATGRDADGACGQLVATRQPVPPRPRSRSLAPARARVSMVGPASPPAPSPPAPSPPAPSPPHWRCPTCHADLLQTSGPGERMLELRCSAGHVVNVAKEGHIHLMPPTRQDPAAAAEADAAVRASRAFYENGGDEQVRTALAREVCRALKACPAGRTLQLLCAGCGEGAFLRSTEGLWPHTDPHADPHTEPLGLWGTDPSKLAVRYAAKRQPGASFAVASQARLPFADGTMDVVLSALAQPPPWEEICRVLRPGGAVIVARHGRDHLSELRAMVGGRAAEEAPPPKQFAAGLAENYLRVREAVSYPAELALPLVDTCSFVRGATREEIRERLEREGGLQVTIDILISTHRVWLGTGGEPPG